MNFVTHCGCCDDFWPGRGLILALVILSGILLSILGISLASRYGDGASDPSRASWPHLCYTGFVMQAAAAAMSALLLAALLLDGALLWEILALGAEALFAGGFLLVNLTCASLALPSWHALAHPRRADDRAVRLFGDPTAP